ncbi:hypothetical protein V3564_02450 [Bartonella sp. B12(2025)]
MSDLFHWPSWFAGKAQVRPLPQLASANYRYSAEPKTREKDRSTTTHNQTVTVHVNGARDPVMTGRAVSAAIQRARGTE